jgi:short subunit dehydrogenase-like uncharacterized protein
MGAQALALMGVQEEGAMTRKKVLLYGATGFTGGLIAAEGAKRGMSRRGRGECLMTLAARDGRCLRAVADKNDMDVRPFGLDVGVEVLRQLEDFDIVINAAGPFALTALPLANAALGACCDYVDINSELDVYRNLDDLALKAEQRGIAIVCGAGSSAAASNLLLGVALAGLSRKGKTPPNGDLGAVRIAMSQNMDFSRGSALSAARMVRSQVAVVRNGLIRGPEGDLHQQQVVSHEPVGRLERMFDLEAAPSPQGKSKQGGRLRIASAANLIDTLTAKHTLAGRRLKADTIESYLEMGTLNRIFYQLSGLFSPLAALPLASAATAAILDLLPEGPTESERLRQRHIVALEIEDAYHRRVVDWRWETPDVYQFTARLAVAAAFGLATMKTLETIKTEGGTNKGWVTPDVAVRLGGFGNLKHVVRGCRRRKQA